MANQIKQNRLRNIITIVYQDNIRYKIEPMKIVVFVFKRGCLSFWFDNLNIVFTFIRSSKKAS